MEEAGVAPTEQTVPDGAAVRRQLEKVAGVHVQEDGKGKLKLHRDFTDADAQK